MHKLSRLLRYIACALLLSSLPAGAAERYLIDPTHTYTTFEYNHWWLSLQRGRFDKNAGAIELDLENKSGSVQLEIEANSISTGHDLFDNALRSANFFDAEHYPKITFKSTALHFGEQDQLVSIDGDLSIKETTRPVTLTLTQFNCRFMLIYLRQACGANGFTKILRSDYRVGRFVPFVSDEVTLYFSVEAIRE